MTGGMNGAKGEWSEVGARGAEEPRAQESAHIPAP